MKRKKINKALNLLGLLVGVPTCFKTLHDCICTVRFIEHVQEKGVW